jgi:uncharacterized RDD family membrane protein YckC
METSATTSTSIAASNYAGFGQRLVAWLIDSIVVGIVYWIVITPILAAAGLGMASGLENSGELTEGQAIGMAGGIMAMVGAVWLIIFAVVVLYFSLMESSKFQASIGKMAMGIKVTDMNGDRITFGKAFLRSIGKIVSSMIMYIGYIMAAFTERKQALHDMIASTLVVKK